MKGLGSSPTILRRSWRLGLWGSATWCVLRLHEMPIAREHSICGPWGCGPAIPALLSAHGFWLLVAIPGAYWAGKIMAKRWVVIMGWAFLGIWVAGIVIVALGALMDWRGHFHPGPRAFVIQRILFALATTVEAPLFPMVFAGLILLNAGRRTPRIGDSSGVDHGDGLRVGCIDGHCDSTAAVDLVPGSGRIEVGKPLPRFTLLVHDGRTIIIPKVVDGRASLFYFMRASGCSLCRKHVRAIARLFEDDQLRGSDVFIVHPQGDRASEILRASLPVAFTVASACDSGAYDAVGLRGRNFGLSPGSGTIFVNERGLVCHVYLSSLPFGAFSEAELIDAKDAAHREAAKQVTRDRKDQSLGGFDDLATSAQGLQLKANQVTKDPLVQLTAESTRAIADSNRQILNEIQTSKRNATGNPFVGLA